MFKWLIVSVLSCFVSVVSAGVHASSAVPKVCQGVNYNYLTESPLGGPCMPNAKAADGYSNSKQCQLIYYCVLREAYDTLINNQHTIVNKPNDAQDNFHFIPNANEVFASFDVELANSAAPLKCDGDYCTTANLMWVVQKKQLQKKLCGNGLVRKQQDNSNFIGLLMHQILGMPPLAANKDNTDQPYSNKGLYVFSFESSPPSLNPDDSNILDFEYKTVNDSPALVAMPGYSISDRVSSVIRLCKSGFQLKSGRCVNKFNNQGEGLRYNTWVKKWIEFVYPTNFLESKKDVGSICEDGGKRVSCLEEYRFFPWASMGATYNWSQFSAQRSRESLVHGMYEYGIPQGVMINKSDVKFIPINEMVSTLCPSKGSAQTTQSQ